MKERIKELLVLKTKFPFNKKGELSILIKPNFKETWHFSIIVYNRFIGFGEYLIMDYEVEVLENKKYIEQIKDKSLIYLGIKRLFDIICLLERLLNESFFNWSFFNLT